jgi:hypothetical protein
MQKHASRFGWRFTAATIFAAVLVPLIYLAGLPSSVGKMSISRPAIGEQPTTGRRGAAKGVTRYAGRGPVEHQ